MKWQQTINLVKEIPYGRNSNRYDFSLILSENKGTCSSKHAFLKEFAEKNDIPNVKLIIGIYKMSQTNTPKIGHILSENKLAYIPEAHCYLKINDEIIDATSSTSDFDKIKKDVIKEIEIEPFQVSDFKIEYHQNFIRNWISNAQIKFTFEEIWEIRERCISQLST